MTDKDLPIQKKIFYETPTGAIMSEHDYSFLPTHQQEQCKIYLSPDPPILRGSTIEKHGVKEDDGFLNFERNTGAGYQKPSSMTTTEKRELPAEDSFLKKLDAKIDSDIAESKARGIDMSKGVLYGFMQGLLYARDLYLSSLTGEEKQVTKEEGK